MTEDPAEVGKIWKKNILNAFFCWNFEHSWVSTVEPPDMWYSVTREAKVPVEIEVRDATLPFPWTNYPHGLGVTCDCLFSLMTIAKQAGYIWYYEYYICNIYIYIWYYMIIINIMICIVYCYIYIYIYIYTYLALYPSQDLCSMQPGSAKGTHWRNHGVKNGCPFLNPVGCWWTSPYL